MRCSEAPCAEVEAHRQSEGTRRHAALDLSAGIVTGCGCESGWRARAGMAAIVFMPGITRVSTGAGR
ncbi:MAG: hypothetical protein ACREJC_15215 [Tepidisphaeraceae bacterium]